LKRQVLRKRERRSSLSLRRRLSYVGKVLEITKVLVALSLYENLKREGELLSMPSDVESEVKSIINTVDCSMDG